MQPGGLQGPGLGDQGGQVRGEGEEDGAVDRHRATLLGEEHQVCQLGEALLAGEGPAQGGEVGGLVRDTHHHTGPSHSWGHPQILLQ